MVEQIAAIAIFVLMFALIVSEKIAREWVSLGCGILTLIVVFGICMHSPKAMINAIVGINWETIIFIFGMMVMVEGMGRAGFFRWLCLMIAKMVRYKGIPLLITFMIMSFTLAMFIDSITVILFLAAVSVELAQLLGFSPIPLILAEVFCANLGGSATMCGDPPNIIIGTTLNYTFADFITNTGLIALISLVITVAYFYLAFRNELSNTETEPEKEPKEYPLPSSAIKDRREFYASSMIFGCAIVMLITHAQTGLTVMSIGIIIAVLTLITAGENAVAILKKVDYRTLVFFTGLFIVVGGLEQTGVLQIIAELIERMCGKDAILMVTIIMIVSAVSSSFIDNIPFAATMIPVIKSLASVSGIPLDVLSWTLALGTDIGGSATPIGASANVVGVSIASRNGYLIDWGLYCKKIVPITAMVIFICLICIFYRYF